MEYTEVDIRLKEVSPYADILAARFNEIEFESYAEDEGGVKAYVQTHLLDENAVKEIITEVAVLSKLSFTIKKVKQENWNALWESNFEPVHINDRCVIRAHFHDAFPRSKCNFNMEMEEPEWANVNYDKPNYQDVIYYSRNYLLIVCIRSKHIAIHR